MRQRRVMAVLTGVLAVAIGILAINLVVLSRNVFTIPEQAVTDLCAALAADGISLNPDILSRSREEGTIYMVSGDAYEENVSVLLSDSPIRSRFVIPDGVLYWHYNNALTEFQNGFTFHYRSSGDEEVLTDDFSYEAFTAGMTELPVTDEKAALAIRFLEQGDNAFAGVSGAPEVEILVASLFEDEAGNAYVRCLRRMDGVEITGNEVVCRIQNGVVTEAAGEWCFLTLEQSWQAQLADSTNILFTMKRDLQDMRGEDRTEIRITEIDRCYSLYFLSGDVGFCLIPCVKITAEPYGILVYNALDSTLYTIISEK